MVLGIGTCDIIKSRGYMNKSEFVEICLWKSPRPKKYYLDNSEESIINISKKALLTNSEETKISLLTSLNGVSIAVASSILTMIYPEKYGVIDIRAWQILHLYGEVKEKPQGKGFDSQDWLNYLIILRKYAIDFNIKVRDIEVILFFSHKKVQTGRLYN